MASSKLNRTETAGNRQIWTFSGWVKRGTISSVDGQYLFSSSDGSNNYNYLQINPSDQLRYLDYTSGNNSNKITSQLFRDCSGYYHIVCAVDTTDGVAEDRVKLYVNGERITAFGTNVNHGASDNTEMNVNTYTMSIGSDQQSGGGQYWVGSMSNIVFVDGTALAPTEFGEVDSTSGIWKYKAPSGITYGTNGFWLKGENSGALGTDSSGEGNTLTVSGSPTQSIDTPSNVYAVMNSIATTNSIGNTLTFSNAGLTATNTAGGAWQPIMSTLAANTGKWYAEFKVDTIGGASKYGIIDVIQYNNQVNWASASRAYGYEYYAGDATNNSTTASYGAAFTTGAIIGVAMDLDNMKLYMSKDGVWQDSGDPTSGSTGTGTLPFFGGASNTARAAGLDTYAFAMNIHNSSVTNANFGSGYFGSTAVSSAGTSSTGDDSIWEHDCPTGYYGLNTKNLNTYG